MREPAKGRQGRPQAYAAAGPCAWCVTGRAKGGSGGPLGPGTGGSRRPVTSARAVAGAFMCGPGVLCHAACVRPSAWAGRGSLRRRRRTGRAVAGTGAATEGRKRQAWGLAGPWAGCADVSGRPAALTGRAGGAEWGRRGSPGGGRPGRRGSGRIRCVAAGAGGAWWSGAHRRAGRQGARTVPVGLSREGPESDAEGRSLPLRCRAWRVRAGLCAGQCRCEGAPFVREGARRPVMRPTAPAA